MPGRRLSGLGAALCSGTTFAGDAVGCLNAKHSSDQRLARWLLLCADRVYSDTFRLSHEFLADMLGMSRPTVSIAAGLLKEEDIIEYTRGLIHIRDAAKLENRACECYRIIKNYLDTYREFDSGLGEARAEP